MTTISSIRFICFGFFTKTPPLFRFLSSGVSLRCSQRPLCAPVTPAKSEPSAPAAPALAATLTKEEAEAIALEYANFTADQVSYLRTEFEIDDRIPQYDVQFHEGFWEYEFEIHAETGAILSFDKDD